MKCKDFTDLIDQKAKDMNTSFIKLICFAAYNHLYRYNRKLAEHFQSLAAGEANPVIDIEKATHIKYFCKMSDVTYTNLRYLLGNNVQLPTVKKVQKHATSILPEGLNWNVDIPNAISAPVENVIKATLERLPRTVAIQMGEIADHSQGRMPEDEQLAEKFVVRVTAGWDGSGNNSIYSSASSLALKNDHLFYSGLSVLDIRTQGGEVVYKVKNPCSPRNVRPVILANANETLEMVEHACNHFDKAYKRFEQGPIIAEISKGTFREFNVELLLTHLDGKAKAQATGLGGAYCIQCTTTSADANNPEKVREGFLMDRTMESLQENFVLLAEPHPETGDLIVKKEKNDYATRKGQTGKPLAPTQSNIQGEIAVLHAWLRSYGLFCNVTYKVNSNCRQFKVNWTKDKEKAHRDAKKVFQEAAERAMNMQIDQPKRGGGNTNNGTAAQLFFSPQKREALMALFHGTDQEKEGYRQLLQNFNVILRLLSSSVMVNTRALDALCKDTMILFIETFPWYPLPQAVHGFLAHCAERIDQNGGVSLGELSEQGMEASNKELREGREKFARKMDLQKNITDVYKRQWVTSDKILWHMKKEPVCKHCYDSGHTTRKCPSNKENQKLEDEELDEDLPLLNSLIMD